MRSGLEREVAFLGVRRFGRRDGDGVSGLIDFIRLFSLGCGPFLVWVDSEHDIDEGLEEFGVRYGG